MVLLDNEAYPTAVLQHPLVIAVPALSPIKTEPIAEISLVIDLPAS